MCYFVKILHFIIIIIIYKLIWMLLMSQPFLFCTFLAQKINNKALSVFFFFFNKPLFFFSFDRRNISTCMPLTASNHSRAMFSLWVVLGTPKISINRHIVSYDRWMSVCELYEDIFLPIITRYVTSCDTKLCHFPAFFFLYSLEKLLDPDYNASLLTSSYWRH